MGDIKSVCKYALSVSIREEDRGGGGAAAVLIDSMTRFNVDADLAIRRDTDVTAVGTKVFTILSLCAPSTFSRGPPCFLATVTRIVVR